MTTYETKTPDFINSMQPIKVYQNLFMIDTKACTLEPFLGTVTMYNVADMYYYVVRMVGAEIELKVHTISDKANDNEAIEDKLKAVLLHKGIL